MANPGIITTDIEADNGVIHVIDGVLLPVSVSSILTATGTDMKIGDDGKDQFSTGGGGDFLDGNAGRDMLQAGKGDDVAIGGAGNDWIFGIAGNDSLLGEIGNDKIQGGDGFDVLDGGAGDDWLSGGKNADTFVFIVGSGIDTITDFDDGKDKIDLSGYVGVHSFEDLHIVDGSNGVRIELEGEDRIKLEHTREDDFDASDFIFAVTSIM